MCDKNYYQCISLVKIFIMSQSEKTGSSSFFENAQRFGKSFMLSIAVLPAAGLLLGIGGSLSNSNTLVVYPFLDVPWLQGLFMLMADTIVFANLAVLFAVGLARSDKGCRSICVAGLSGDER